MVALLKLTAGMRSMLGEEVLAEFGTTKNGEKIPLSTIMAIYSRRFPGEPSPEGKKWLEGVLAEGGRCEVDPIINTKHLTPKETAVMQNEERAYVQSLRGLRLVCHSIPHCFIISCFSPHSITCDTTRTITSQEGCSAK